MTDETEFIRFVQPDVFDDDDMIVCKMDVEGSEYPILRNLLSRKIISKLHSIYIEFHHSNIDYESQATSNQLIHEIATTGVRAIPSFKKGI